MHHNRTLKAPRVKMAGKLCVADCDRPAKSLGLCPAHYWQLRNRGYLSDIREVGVANRVAVEGEVAHIVLTDNEGQEAGRAIIDAADLAAVSEHRWRSHVSMCSTYKPYVSRPYARAHGIGGLDAFLLKPPKGFEVDHINGDTLDNRRANLVVVPFRYKAVPGNRPKPATP